MAESNNKVEVAPAVVQGQVIQATVVGAPGQMSMGAGPGGGVMVYQKTSQCCRCCCCQPNIDWTIHDFMNDWSADVQMPTKMYIKEDAPWIGRCMSNPWPAWRKTNYTVHNGEDATGEVLFKHEKSWTCSNCPVVMYSDGGPVRCPACCCLPYLETKGPGGELLGRSQYICDACLFVPKFHIFDKSGNQKFLVRPDTCVGGICVKCRWGGGQKGKCFRIPFPIRTPEGEQIGDAAITDLWAGMKHECCTQREMYSVKFPANLSDEDIKKTLIGCALLIDITLNEQDQ